MVKTPEHPFATAAAKPSSGPRLSRSTWFILGMVVSMTAIYLVLSLYAKDQTEKATLHNARATAAQEAVEP